MCCKTMHSLTSLLNLHKQRVPPEMDQAYTGLPSDWYQKEAIVYSFSHPYVMSRLERLMGTNIVVLTDRKYMLELQRRIQEDHVNAIKERIKERERDELDREKNLILEGKIPLTETPQELMDHPVFRITQMANDFIKELNEKTQKRTPKVNRPSNEENPCDVLEPHYLRPRQRAASVVPPQAEQAPRFSMESTSSESEASEQGKESEDHGEEEEESLEKSERRKRKERPSEDSDIQNGYVFPQDQYDRLHYETDHVKAMWTLETVEDLYDMAEQVVKDVVAHRPHEGHSPSSSRLQPPPSTKSAEDSNLDRIDTTQETQSSRPTSKTPPKTGMKFSKANSKEEKKEKKQRFSWANKKNKGI